MRHRRIGTDEYPNGSPMHERAMRYRVGLVLGLRLTLRLQGRNHQYFSQYIWQCKPLRCLLFYRILPPCNGVLLHLFHYRLTLGLFV